MTTIPTHPHEGSHTTHIVVIAHYAHWLLNFRLPLLKALKNRADKVTVFVPEPSPQLRVELLGYGIDCIHYPLQRTGLNPLADSTTLLSLTRLLKLLCPTHVLTTAIKPNIYGSYAARSAGIINTVSLITGLGYAFMGDTIKRKLMSSVATLLYRTAFVKNKRIIFQNQDDRDEFISRRITTKAQSSIVNGSGVDLDKYKYTPPVNKQETNFLMISRLVAEKGVLEYIDAANILRDRGVPAKFVLIGPFDENPSAVSREELENLLKDSNINYEGEVKDVRPALKNCDVFVLPSYREGTPRSTLEALAIGRAVITTDAPGCRETVVDELNGFLVPVADSLALADAMQRINLSPKRIHEMGKASYDIAREKYDVVLVNASMIDMIFDEI